MAKRFLLSRCPSYAHYMWYKIIKLYSHTQLSVY